MRMTHLYTRMYTSCRPIVRTTYMDIAKTCTSDTHTHDTHNTHTTHTHHTHKHHTYTHTTHTNIHTQQQHQATFADIIACTHMRIYTHNILYMHNIM